MGLALETYHPSQKSAQKQLEDYLV